MTDQPRTPPTATIRPPGSGITIKWSPTPTICEHPVIVDGSLEIVAHPPTYSHDKPVQVVVPSRWCIRCSQTFDQKPVVLPIDPAKQWRISSRRIAPPTERAGNRRTRRSITRKPQP